MYLRPGSPEPADEAIVFTADDAGRLKARIDEDPDEAVLLLEQTVAGSSPR